jgi:uridine kinase
MSTAVTDIHRRMTNAPKPCLVVIGGYGGSGKTTLARALGALSGGVVVSADSFIVNRCQGDTVAWSCIDRVRIKRELIDPYLQGEASITYGVYNWATNTVDNTMTVTPTDILILEGIGVCVPDILKEAGVSVWIDCPLDMAMRRGSARDREAGSDHDQLWYGLWQKNEEEFIARYCPTVHVDIVVPYIT